MKQQTRYYSDNSPLHEYKLSTVTYTAPFLAMMTLKQLAKNEGNIYSIRAKQAIEEQIYNYNVKMFRWTDSTNRVEQIKTIRPSECWCYIKSKDNPVDYVTVKQLQQHPL